MAQNPINAAEDLLARALNAVGENKIAVIDETGAYTYGALAQRVAKAAQGLIDLGLRPGDRLLLCMLDSVDFHTAFLGAIKAGIVPVPVNTLFTTNDYAYIANDSGAVGAVVSAALAPQFHEGLRHANWRGVLIVAGEASNDKLRFGDVIAQSAPLQVAYSPGPREPAFWLYSSGSTGRPKGTVHMHASLGATADLFAKGVLDICPDDVIFSAAKLFFAYGLGNSLSFPMSVGATVVLTSARITPALVCEILTRHPVTIFCGVPTLFSALLASPLADLRDRLSLRLCTSAGEALPESVARAWTQHVGVEIIDGIGSTEMLHIFLSNRPGAVRHGVTGRAVAGYSLRVLDDNGEEAPAGEVGELLVSGPSAATHYWNNPGKTEAVFNGEWVRTGDKFVRTDDDHYIFCGRVDDMLKVGGIWVSPAEVESAIIAHDAVLEAAVIGVCDENNLVKPKAFVVCHAEASPGPDLEAAIQAFVKARIAPYKYPRWIEFVDALPKTATGKIQRFALRARGQPASG